MNCPFKVGDIIHEIRPVLMRLPPWPMRGKSSCVLDELDESRPDAVVTKITEHGFTYAYDYPVPIGRAEWGEAAWGGDVYEAGFGQWRKVGETLDTRT
jgi:hypothetical protein